MSPPEFHRPLPFAAVKRTPYVIELTPTETERAALVARLGLLDLPRFTAKWELRSQADDTVAAKLTIAAEVVQPCVVTLEPVPQTVADTVSLRFLPPGREPSDNDPDTPDDIPCEHEVMDLGEAAVETLALLLDPYPRAEGASLPDSVTDKDLGPFGALAKLNREG